jgi:uncharacterized protein
VEHPFQRWVDLARPRAQLWRTVLGVAMVVAVWIAWTMGLFVGSLALGVTTPALVNAALGAGLEPASYPGILITLAILLGTLAGLGLGVWSVAGLWHRRRVQTVLGHGQRFDWGQFLIGAGLASGYLGISMIAALMSGATPARSSLPFETWFLALMPMAVVIFIQSASEEIFFRGYLIQQLAARVRNPVVWGFLPAIAFGLAHASYGSTDLQFGIYYVLAATLLGLVMTATVWRTGGLAVAVGFHAVNNIGALLVVGAGVGAPVSLFVMDIDKQMQSAPVDLLVLGMLLAFVLSPFAPLPQGQPLRRK